MCHCYECNACVEGHDHHCGVVGTCIGDKTFKYFIQFMTYGGLQFGLVGVAILVSMVGKTAKDGIEESLK